MGQSRRAVFFDRDGVLNRAIVRNGKPYAPSSLDEFQIVPDAQEELRRLQKLGFLTIVVSNQPDIARGAQSAAVIEKMNEQLRRELRVDDVLVCPHDDADDCDCRKPKPGLLIRAAKEYGLDLAKCFMVGDRWRDIDAGTAAGCSTILIDFHYDERSPSMPPSFSVSSLEEAVDSIVRQVEEECHEPA